MYQMRIRVCNINQLLPQSQLSTSLINELQVVLVPLDFIGIREARSYNVEKRWDWN